MQNALEVYVDAIKALIREDELAMAIEKLDELDKKAQIGIEDEVTSQYAMYRRNEKNLRDGTLTNQEYGINRNKTRSALQSILEDIPRKVALNAKIHGLTAYQFNVPDEANLEKIIGPGNNLLRINWLEKALKASKAVCRVVCADGNLGTGFLDSDGYLYTNNHVLGSAEIAAQARIEFNYEMDAGGNVKSRSSYTLDAGDFKTSPPNQFDFARVRVIDNPADPIKQWGFLEIDPTALPTVGEPVTIIQHPKGEDKQIALHANEVIGLLNQHLFYTTDTEPGSSGSPVFNKDWKVVAIHHAGKTDAEGGLVINARGDRKGANRGILFGSIYQFLGKKGGAATTHSTSVSDGGGKESIDSIPAPAPVHTPVPAPVHTPAPPTNPTRFKNTPPLFVIVYDVADAEDAGQLSKHLKLLKMQKKIQLYDVHNGLLGKDYLKEARNQIANADCVIALVSINLFGSDDWYPLVDECLEQGYTLVPVRLDKTLWDGFEVAKRQSIPTQRRSVKDFRSPDEAWTDVVAELKKLL